MKIIILILAVLVGVSALSQDTTFIYFDKNWKTIDKMRKATYVKKSISIENSYVIEIGRYKGQLLYSGNYSSLNPEIEDGYTYHYDEDGKVLEQSFFNNGCPDSIWVVFNKTTEKYDSLDYSGVREILEQANAPFSFDEIFAIVDEMPTFPNNYEVNLKSKYSDFRSYVKANSYYPMMARRKTIKGYVHVNFVVGPDGMVYDIRVLTSKSNYLDYEAVRIISESPMWNPGKQRNIAVPVRVTMGVGFFPNE